MPVLEIVITEGVDEFPTLTFPKFTLVGETEILGNEAHTIVTVAFVFVTEAVLVCGETLVSIPVTFVFCDSCIRIIHCCI